MTEETTNQPQPFDASTLLTLRESARTYQKLDLAYIAAAGAIATAFKLNTNDIIDVTAQLWIAAAAVLILLGYDTLLEKMIFSDWIACKQSKKERLSSTTITKWLSRQPLLHFLFIAMIIGGGASYARGSYDAIQVYKAEAYIQLAVEHFIIKQKRVPSSVDELVSKSSFTERYFDLLGRSQVRIEPSENPKEKYRIVYPGRDGKIGTDDDEVATAEMNFMDVYERLRPEKKEK